MALESPLIAPSPADRLLSKLDDPRVTAALSDLLDHADLLAILVVGLDGLFRRGEEFNGALGLTLRQVQEVTGLDSVGELDLPKLTASLVTLSGALSDVTPTLKSLVKSDLADERMIDVVSLAARAIIKGSEQAKAEPVKASGVFSLMRALKDDDVARGVGFLIQVARAFGKELDEV
jgi:hypothetical protein